MSSTSKPKPDLRDKALIQAFVKTLTKKEREYVWDHVYRYVGVEGSTAAEQFARLIEYVLFWLDGSSKMETSIFDKALKMFDHPV